MNRRLTTIFDQIDAQIGVIDVGTDHGYIPMALALRGFEGKIIASDIHAEPLNAARKTAAEAGVAGRIIFQRCDGLALCQPNDIDCIVIAGMGGDMIVKILDEAEWCMDSRYQLVLQPMTKAEVVRYWLAYNEFEIEMEALVEDSGTIYQIMTARFGGKTVLSDAELFTGKRENAKDPYLFDTFVAQTAHRFEKMVNGLAAGESSSPAREELYRRILMDLKAMG